MLTEDQFEEVLENFDKMIKQDKEYRRLVGKYTSASLIANSERAKKRVKLAVGYLERKFKWAVANKEKELENEKEISNSEQ